MTTPSALCAACFTPLRTGEARITDAGYVHVSDPGCRITAGRLAGEPLAQALQDLHDEGASSEALAVAANLPVRAIERELYDGTDEIAYMGGWEKRGLIWRPVRKDVA